MNVLVVGSVALDNVETPFGKIEDAIGGSAIFFSTAASYFAPVNLVGVVGEDFPLNSIEFLKERNVDLTGLKVEEGETFRWGGKYFNDLNKRETLFTHLNVFEAFKPILPEEYKNSEFVFLANIDPTLQQYVLGQMNGPRLVACDTMNYWIERTWDDLERTLRMVDILIINDEEVRQLTNEYNFIRAARVIRSMGPETLIVKKGENGALLITEDCFFFPYRLIHWNPYLILPVQAMFSQEDSWDTLLKKE